MKKTFRSKIILMNTLSVIIALIISSSYLLISFSKMTTDNTIEEINRTIDNTINQYRANFEDLYNLSYSLIAVPSIRNWATNDIDWESNNLKDIMFRQQLKIETDSSLMFNNTWKSKLVNSIGFFAGNYKTLLAQRLSVNLDELQLSLSDVYIETKNIKDTSFFFMKGKEIYFVQRVLDVSYEKSVTYVYEINTEVFLNLLNRISPEINVRILFYGSELYSHKSTIENNQLSIKLLNILNSDVGFTVNEKIKNTPLEFEIIVPETYLNEPIVSTMKTMIVVFLIIVLIVTAIVIYISSTTTRFMVKLVNGINEIKTHKMGHTLERNKDEDLNEIVEAFNSMSLELKDLIDKGYKSDVLLLQSNIRQLQSQMNPHFLINTLASISTSSLLFGDEKTYEMITALSTVLDQSMYNTKDYSPMIELRDEMKYINCYLKIQKFRFEDKLEVNLKVDETLYSVLVPRFSIEPLIENAVIYGVQDSIEKCLINIEIKKINNSICAIVNDNGKSLMRKNPLTINSTKSHHIAVKNTNNRIHLLFGEEYGIVYNFEKTDETDAILHLPIVEKDNNHIEEFINV